MSFSFTNLDGQTFTEGNKNPMEGFLGLPSITGGASAPSSGFAAGSTATVTMNNPFSVAGAGGKANSTASTDAGSSNFLLWAALAVVFLVGMK